MKRSLKLPRIDEHAIVIDATPSRVWEALGEVLSHAFPRGSRAIGRLLRVRPLEPCGETLTAGAALPGFHVVRSEPGVELALEGAHRFSRYGLVFRIDYLGDQGVRLRAETRADFPGSVAAVYRFLVIGTRGHVVIVRRLLRATRRRVTTE